jgi:hypothetical protein
VPFVEIPGVTRPLCRIRMTLGEVEACPRGACPFWEHGGAVVESACGLERLGLDLERPDLAEYLVELRGRLETARDEREREAARQAFAEIVPPEFSGR